jgi:hypothetical protein
LPQPRVERQWPVADVAAQAAVGLDEDLLDHVGRVDAGGQARIQAERDRPPQPVAVPLQQRPAGQAAPGAGAAEKLVGVVVGGAHRSLSRPAGDRQRTRV